MQTSKSTTSPKKLERPKNIIILALTSPSPNDIANFEKLGETATVSKNGLTAWMLWKKYKNLGQDVEIKYIRSEQELENLQVTITDGTKVYITAHGSNRPGSDTFTGVRTENDGKTTEFKIHLNKLTDELSKKFAANATGVVVSLVHCYGASNTNNYKSRGLMMAERFAQYTKDVVVIARTGPTWRYQVGMPLQKGMDTKHQPSHGKLIYMLDTSGQVKSHDAYLLRNQTILGLMTETNQQWQKGITSYRSKTMPTAEAMELKKLLDKTYGKDVFQIENNKMYGANNVCIKITEDALQKILAQYGKAIFYDEIINTLWKSDANIPFSEYKFEIKDGKIVKEMGPNDYQQFLSDVKIKYPQFDTSIIQTKNTPSGNIEMTIPSLMQLRLVIGDSWLLEHKQTSAKSLDLNDSDSYTDADIAFIFEKLMEHYGEYFSTDETYFEPPKPGAPRRPLSLNQSSVVSAPSLSSSGSGAIYLNIKQKQLHFTGRESAQFFEIAQVKIFNDKVIEREQDNHLLKIIKLEHKDPAKREDADKKLKARFETEAKLHREVNLIQGCQAFFHQQPTKTVAGIILPGMGVSLAKLLKNKKIQLFTDEQKIQLLKDILTKLDKMHQMGYVHHNISPNNILYNEITGEVNLVGFGNAHLENDSTFVANPTNQDYMREKSADKSRATAFSTSDDLYALAGVMADIYGIPAALLKSGTDVTLDFTKDEVKSLVDLVPKEIVHILTLISSPNVNISSIQEELSGTQLPVNQTKMSDRQKLQYEFAQSIIHATQITGLPGITVDSHAADVINTLRNNIHGDNKKPGLKVGAYSLEISPLARNKLIKDLTIDDLIISIILPSQLPTSSIFSHSKIHQLSFRELWDKYIAVERIDTNKVWTEQQKIDFLNAAVKQYITTEKKITLKETISPVELISHAELAKQQNTGTVPPKSPSGPSH